MEKRSFFWMPLAMLLLTGGCASAPAGVPAAASGLAAAPEAAEAPAARGYGLLNVRAPKVQLAEPTCSSTLSKWFPACALVDGNLHTAWMPACTDRKPCLTYDLPCRTNVRTVKIKASCRATCEIDVRTKGGEWETVLCDLKPTSGQLCSYELPRICDAEQLRIRFCGKDMKDIRVCEVELCGTPVPVLTAL